MDVTVLQYFESHLWDEMRAAIGDTIPRVHSRPNMVGRRELTFLWRAIRDGCPGVLCLARVYASLGCYAVK